MMRVLMISPPFLTVLGVVREKESGSIFNIYSSTVSRGEFLIGKIAPYVGISTLNVVVLWLLAEYFFGAPFKGSSWFFFAASVIYVICTAGIGLLVSVLVYSAPNVPPQLLEVRCRRCFCAIGATEKHPENVSRMGSPW
jgi:ABC-2 type transport system permease protein/ribosome-dependent ATPase